MPIEAIAEPVGDAPPKKRGPGRPKGSKNKPKSAVDQFARENSNGDAPPGGGTGKTRKRRGRVNKQTTKAIEGALAEILCLPAMAGAMTGDQWASEHFVVNGKELANRLAVYSERNDQFRGWCEKLLQGESMAVVGFALVAYIVPPLLHYNIVPGPDGMLGVPRRPKRGKRARKQQGVPESPTDATDWYREQTEQQKFEAAKEAREFYGEDDPNVPPTYTDVD